jgi:putative DNA primase/helicase
MSNNAATGTQPRVSHGTQDDVAVRFAQKYSERFRYVAAWNRWHEWDGQRWRYENTLHSFDAARAMLRDVAKADAKDVAGVITLARADRLLAATPEQWDANPWLLGTPGGTVDLHTGELLRASADDYITKITAATPDGDCPIPRWRKFLRRITGGDVELMRYLQRVAGYALTGDTSEDALFFFWGLGANGKSVFIRTVTGIVGDYAKTTPMETFTATKNDRHPADLAALRGARLVTATESQADRSWDEAKIKLLTGGDKISARFMRQDFFEFTPQFKLMISGNHRPKIRNVDEAITRRMNLIPFAVTIPKAERDRKLSNKLEREWPGILAWMIEGCLQWQLDGLNAPEAVVEATDEYLTSEDTIQSWIDECCDTGSGMTASVTEAWVSFKNWAEQAREFIGSKRQFCQKLGEKGYPRYKGTHGMRGFKGLRVR